MRRGADTVGAVAKQSNGPAAGAVGLARQQKAAGSEPAYPGQRFGLPRSGPMSVATLGRRLLALCVDWAISLLIADGLLHDSYWAIVIFAVESFILTATTGTTVGMRVFGTRVIRVDGRPLGFGWAALRTLLLLAVVPPLLSDRDLRGLHDRAADAIVVRL
jgi:uncharacterized RDD family membrane protein YckC